ncbi:ATP-grasp domain-containing protein [Nocardiopsis sp. CC223A]|uniref:ATP-grasp domain-containing protein n=1 Tax=Nocardiopsis sp. CC223A TaxID=3044051 RepID=UPI00278C4BE2|nr:ATP-grasp domain-containing protein [Nocardiopsis sp. CC223A]
MPAPSRSPFDSATHVLVGYSRSVLSDLDRFLPPGSVLVLEEPEVIEKRGVRDRIGAHPSAALLMSAPCQDEAAADRFADAVPRPPRVRAVVPSVEYGAVAAAALAQAWGLPGATLAAARRLRDKVELRRTAGRSGLPQPRWAEVGDADGVRDFAASAPRGCVLKPANRQASVGVRILDGPADAAAAWAHTTTADEAGMRAPGALRPRYLVEERVHGPEVSVEVLVRRGRALFTNITAKSVQDDPLYPVESGHVLPAPLPVPVAAELTEAMDGLIRATGFGSGILHAEWILDAGAHPHLIECAGRPPGDRLTDLVDLVYGGHLVRDLVHVLEEGGPVVDRTGRTADGAAAIRFLDVEPGLVEAVEGVSGVADRPAVRDVRVGAREGDTVRGTTSSWDRPGYVIAIGPDAASATAEAASAAASITVRTRPAPEPATL